MVIKTIDLYDYFKIEKPTGAKGILTAYVRDVSEEINPLRKVPAALIIPGGGYGMVSFREAEPIAMKYLAYGFNAFVLDYSIVPLRYPTQIVEASMAAAYIRLNADKLLTNANQLFAVGFSAGGHLAAMLGSVKNCPDVEKYFKTTVDIQPNAVVLSYPVITSDAKTAHMGSFDNLCGENNTELKKKVDILNFINENSAPAFIWSTYNDAVVPCANALLAALKYNEYRVPFSVCVLGKGEHGLSCADITAYGTDKQITEASVSASEWIRHSVEWLAEQGICVR